MKGTSTAGGSSRRWNESKERECKKLVDALTNGGCVERDETRETLIPTTFVDIWCYGSLKHITRRWPGERAVQTRSLRVSGCVLINGTAKGYHPRITLCCGLPRSVGRGGVAVGGSFEVGSGVWLGLIAALPARRADDFPAPTLEALQTLGGGTASRTWARGASSRPWTTPPKAFFDSHVGKPHRMQGRDGLW